MTSVFGKFKSSLHVSEAESLEGARVVGSNIECKKVSLMKPANFHHYKNSEWEFSLSKVESEWMVGSV